MVPIYCTLYSIYFYWLDFLQKVMLNINSLKPFLKISYLNVSTLRRLFFFHIYSFSELSYMYQYLLQRTTCKLKNNSIFLEPMLVQLFWFEIENQI